MSKILSFLVTTTGTQPTTTTGVTTLPTTTTGTGTPPTTTTGVTTRPTTTTGPPPTTTTGVTTLRTTTTGTGTPGTTTTGVTTLPTTTTVCVEEELMDEEGISVPDSYIVDNTGASVPEAKPGSTGWVPSLPVGNVGNFLDITVAQPSSPPAEVVRVFLTGTITAVDVSFSDDGVTFTDTVVSILHELFLLSGCNETVESNFRNT